MNRHAPNSNRLTLMRQNSSSMGSVLLDAILIKLNLARFQFSTCLFMNVRTNNQVSFLPRTYHNAVNSSFAHFELFISQSLNTAEYQTRNIFHAFLSQFLFFFHENGLLFCRRGRKGLYLKFSQNIYSCEKQIFIFIDTTTKKSLISIGAKQQN